MELAAASRAFLRASTAETGFAVKTLGRLLWSSVAFRRAPMAESGLGEAGLEASFSSDGGFGLLFFFCLFAIVTGLSGAEELCAEASLDDDESRLFCCCRLALNAAAALCGAVEAGLSGVLDQKNWHPQGDVRADGASEPGWWSILRLFTILPLVALTLKSSGGFARDGNGKIWRARAERLD